MPPYARARFLYTHLQHQLCISKPRKDHGSTCLSTDLHEDDHGSINKPFLSPSPSKVLALRVTLLNSPLHPSLRLLTCVNALKGRCSRLSSAKRVNVSLSPNRPDLRFLTESLQRRSVLLVTTTTPLEQGEGGWHRRTVPMTGSRVAAPYEADSRRTEPQGHDGREPGLTDDRTIPVQSGRRPESGARKWGLTEKHNARQALTSKTKRPEDQAM